MTRFSTRRLPRGIFSKYWDVYKRIFFFWVGSIFGFVEENGVLGISAAAALFAACKKVEERL